MLGSLVIRTRKPPPPAPVKVCPETIRKLLSEKPSGSQGEVLRISSDRDHGRNFFWVGNLRLRNFFFFFWVGVGGGGLRVVEKFSKYFLGWFDLNRDFLVI